MKFLLKQFESFIIFFILCWYRSRAVSNEDNVIPWHLWIIYHVPDLELSPIPPIVVVGIELSNSKGRVIELIMYVVVVLYGDKYLMNQSGEKISYKKR